MSSIRFESLGLYLPSNVVSTSDLVKQSKKEIEFDLERITGIKSRRFRSDEENSFSMAVDAARDCLEHSSYEAKDMDVIINTSITRIMDNRHYIEPSFSVKVIEAIGARKDVIHFDISNACAGMFTGAYILYNMIKSGKVKNGMVVCGESFSDISRTALLEVRNKIDLQFASLTFGDSGAAFVMDAEGDENEGIEVIDFVTVAEYSELCIGMPSTDNPGLAIYTKTKEIHDENIKRWPSFIDGVLKKNGLDFVSSQIDFLIPHQTSTRAIDAILATGEAYFNAPMPTALCSVVDYGNTTSTTHFVALYNSIKEKQIKPTSRCLLLGNASGIVISCIIFKAGNLNSLCIPSESWKADEVLHETPPSTAN
jgi:3-oxoacyl-[acyl-carrier-protein] synthase III